ncbi:hypothetical protein bcgnr5378_07100 [Bacillus cereus]|uniref:Uncharacterized protein n=1 Tax=Bacillus cereus TaxID=1396 RepID=A0A161T5D4_BACCE|nr:hypothetical protein [Bacillus cereus]KZD65966.1 hypothetical protein B4088_2723 [Bacillus cereus]
MKEHFANLSRTEERVFLTLCGMQLRDNTNPITLNWHNLTDELKMERDKVLDCLETLNRNQHRISENGTYTEYSLIESYTVKDEILTYSLHQQLLASLQTYTTVLPGIAKETELAMA